LAIARLLGFDCWRGGVMSEPKRVNFWLIIGVMLVIIFIVFEVRAQQDHTCQGGHNCNDGAADIVNTIAGDDFRALSVSQSLGAAAISGCIVTTQWGIPIIFQRQSFHYDVFCLARELDKAKKYNDAAAMRCTHNDTAKLYGERCLSVMNYEPPKPPKLEKPDLTKTLVGQVPDEDDDARYDELLKRLDKYENERQQANRSYTAQQQVQQQQYEEIKQIETARKRKIELIREEFGSEQATETDH